jgi:UDP-glucose 4-epimerase
MRVVVIGATGNLGTGVLRRLHAAGAEIVGVARRMPDASLEPYSGVTWRLADIGAAGAVSGLAATMRGADAVIHLGWALQPNHRERVMHRTNVVGTAHVLEAVAQAGVPQVVVASSVGAYSAAPKDRPRDESWPTGGIHTSHYSRHKAENERAMDAFEAAHPDVVVTRMRPGLVMHDEAAAEIARLFLGRRIPTRWMGLATRTPVLPLPRELVSQVVHNEDVADAFWRAVERRAPGAFNIAADPVVDPALVGRLLDARVVAVPLPALRALVSASWRARVQRTDPGWIDIAANVPVMSTARAREVLGWTPTHTAEEVLTEFGRAFVHRTGREGSAPLAG